MVHESIEKHGLKITVGVAVSIVLFIIMTTLSFTSWKTSMEAEHLAMTVRQDFLSDGHFSIREYIDVMEKRQDSTEITLTRVETKLISIETLLLQMREDMRG